jgi:glycosyltransferase involved in cell wall biosynthesis
MTSGWRPNWAIIIAFYNEERFIAPTVACALRQDRDDILVLCVDNGSTDGSAAMVAEAIKGHERALLITETTPGQSCAFRAGFAVAQQMGAENIAFWDADTEYPQHYISRADALMGSDPRVVGVQAFDIYGPFNTWKNRLIRHRLALTASLLSGQSHTGFFGYAIRTAALAAIGGPKNDAWPYVLHDHELIHRVLKQGRLTHAADHVCWPAPRRTVKGHVRWNLAERLLYALTPYAVKDWFFYRFLGPRLRARGMFEAGLRVRDWEQ